MKRFILCSLICSIFLLSFAGCNITVEDTSLLKCPDVEETSSGIGIRLSILNAETTYINLYRKDVTDIKDTSTVSAVNIGMIFPQVIGTTSSSYFYEDLNVLKGHKYQYYARYKDNESFYLTSNSISIKCNNGYDSSTRLSYNTDKVRFTFSEKNQTLRINGTIINPEIVNFEEEYVPVISVKSDTDSQVFELGSISDGEDINLRGILSSEFMDKEIKIIGILGQKKEYAEQQDVTEIKSKQIKRIIWTEPAELSISGHQDGVIKITSDSGTSGYDYS